MNPHSDQAARRTRTGFVNNWVDGGEDGSRSLRRRVMAILRIAHRMLGIRRKGLGLGLLGLRGARLAGLSLVATLGFAAPASAQVFVDDGMDPTCAIISDVTSSSGAYQYSVVDARCNTGHATQTVRSMFYGVGSGALSNSLSLGGQLYVNMGEIGVTDVYRGTYAMRLGSQATMAATSGANAIAIGSAQTSTGDGASTAATIASGNAATAIGAMANASGLNSIAVGSAAAASAQGSTAIGSSAGASGVGSAALGRGAKAAGASSAAMGDGANASGGNSTAVGAGATGSATGATAVGVGANASGPQSTAIGRSAAAPGASAVAVGDTASAQTANAVAVGTKASALGGASVSIGNGNVANGNGAVAIGDPNTATGTGAVAQGFNNTATGDGTTAIGNNNMVGGGGQAVSTAGTAAQGAVGIGFSNTVVGQGSVALGNQSKALQAGSIAMGDTAAANATKGMALGSGATATNANDVALGSGSVTAAPNPTASMTVNGTTYNFAGTSPTSVVSVGGVGAERQITNVAAGRISSTSTDAINGSQLYATNQAVTAVGDRAVKYDLNPDGTVNYGSSTLAGPVSTDGGVTGGTKITNLAQGAVTSTSTDAINGAQLYSVQQLASAGWNVTTAATGTGTVSGTTVHNIAPGATATFTAGNNIAVTQNGAEVQIATSMTPTFTSVTTGNTKIDNNGLTIVGGPSVTSTGIDAGGTRITNVAPGTAGTDAVNLTQMTTAVTAVKTHYYSVNDGGTAAGNYNNDGATGTNALAAGVGAVATGTGSTAIGFGATANNANDVALGSGSVTAAANPTASTVINGTTYTFAGISPTSVVSVGGVGTERQITNVAAGRISGTSTDAINGSQLYATNQAIDTLSQGTVKYDTAGGTVNYNSITLAGPGGTKITNVAPGAVTSSSTDAVNGSQLYSVQQLAGAGWNVTTKATGTGKVTGTTVQNVAPGSTATFTAGNNIEITQVGSEIQIATSMTPSFTSVTTGNTKIDTNGLTIVGGPSVTTSGIDAGGSRITNVAAGIAPTDAANMSQVNNAVSAAKTHYYSVNDGGTASGNYNNDGATGLNALAAGVGASATGAGSTAIGFGATAKNAGDVALGQGSTTAAAVATTSTTIGGKTYTFAGTSPTSTVSVGSVGAERTVTNVAAGRLSSTSTDAINGSQLYATNQAVNVLYNGGAGPVQYSNSSSPTTPNGGTPTNDLTLVGGSSGPVVLHNVGDGAVSSTSTDAINGRQFYAVQANVPGSWQSPTSNTYALGNPAGGGGPVTLSNVAPGALSPTSNQAVNGAQLYATNQAINNIATGFGNLQSQIDSNARRADAGIATAAALGMIRYDDRPGKLSTGAAVTYHHSQAGLAMGAGYTTEDRLWRVSAGLAFSPTNGSAADVTAGASATYTWN